MTTASNDPKELSHIPYSLPTLDQDEIQEVMNVVKSGWITSGPKVAQFEEQFQKWLGKHAISETSATAGLHIVLHALGFKKGDEVITTAMTWPSTVNLIELVGATPVFVDVDPDTLEMDVTQIQQKLSKRTRAVIPVHYAGQPCDLDAIQHIIGRRKIHVVEDAAHALGTTYKGKLIGSFGEVAIFSFHPIKNITTAEGGMIVCGDDEFARRLRLIRFHGVQRNAWQRYAQGGGPQYDVEEPGFKYNMTDLQAALGIHQFNKLEQFNQARTQQALRYRKLLADIPEIAVLKDVPYPATHAWQLFVVKLRLDMLTVGRDEFVKALNEEKVGTGLHFLAVHLLSYYQKKYGYKRGDLPHTEAASDAIFSLPLYPRLKEQEQERVVDTLRRLCQKYRR